MKTDNNIPTNISKPAQRALANASITTLKQLATYTETEIAKLHGIGPDAIKKIKAAFAENDLSFTQ